MKKTYKFYYPDGNEIANISEFIEFYSQVYYYQNRNLELEDRIEKILEKDEISNENVFDILRWKIGAKTFDKDKGTVTNQWKTINSKEVYEKITKCKKDDAIALMNTLRQCKGIGAVYAITILFFLSAGNYPIYDRFAHIALKEIGDLKAFNETISDKELKEEINVDSVKNDKIFDGYSKYYIKRLNDIFGENEYKNNRKIDQALWAYGHLFSDTKTNRNNTVSEN